MKKELKKKLITLWVVLFVFAMLALQVWAFIDGGGRWP